MKEYKLCIGLILFFFLFPSIAQAITLGSLQKNSYSSVENGSTTEFTILLWNPDKTRYPISLKEGHVPTGMEVVIEPKELLLRNSLVKKFPAKSGKEYVNTQYGLIETTPVKVKVNISKEVKPGSYDIFVFATVGTPTSGDSTIMSTLLRKGFRFTINVTEKPPEKPEIKPPSKPPSSTTPPPSNIVEDIGKKVKEEGELLLGRLTGMFSVLFSNINIALWIILTLIILAISWAIYKYA